MNEEDVARDLRQVASVAMELSDAAQFTPEMTVSEVLRPMLDSWGSERMEVIGETAHAVGTLIEELLGDAGNN